MKKKNGKNKYKWKEFCEREQYTALETNEENDLQKGLSGFISYGFAQNVIVLFYKDFYFFFQMSNKKNVIWSLYLSENDKYSEQHM